MATIYETRVRLAIAGGSGGGYNVFYSSSAGSFQTNLKGFYDAIKAYFPTQVSFTVPGVGRTLDDTDGHVTGDWTMTPLAGTVGTASGLWSAPTGCVVSWKTNTPHYRHILQGRTFLVPLGGAMYATDGSLDTAGRAAIETAAQNLITVTGGALMVWGRPKLGKDANGEVIVLRPGHATPALKAIVNDKAAVLTSRRDI